MLYAVKKKVNADHQCGAECKYYGQCRYMRYLQYIRSPAHDFQICNHNMIINDAMRRKQGRNHILPNYQAVIVDESSRLSQAAQAACSIRFSSYEFSGIRERLDRLPIENSYKRTTIMMHIDNLLRLNKRFFKSLLNHDLSDAGKRPSNRKKVWLGKSAMSWRKCLLANLKELLALLQGEQQDNDVIYRLHQAQYSLQSLSNPETLKCWLELPAGFVEWYDDIREYVLQAMPRDVDGLLRDDLWSRPLPFVLA